MKKNNPIIYPLFSSPVYREETEFRVNSTELKTIKSLSFVPSRPTPKKFDWSRPGHPVDISKDHEILKQKALKRIKNFIDEKAQYFFKKLLFLKNELVITQSWVSRGQTGGTHHKHRHPNALFSVVYYVDCPSAQLRFSREDNFLDNSYLFSYDFEQYNFYTSRHWTVPVKTGDLFIFPGSLFHESSPNQHSTDKWVLGANYFFKKVPVSF